MPSSSSQWSDFAVLELAKSRLYRKIIPTVKLILVSANFSFNLNEEPPISTDSNKKRKLPHEPVDLPSPKHKFRDRSCGSENESSSDNRMKGDDDDAMLSESTVQMDYRTSIANLLHPVDSEKDSNSITGGYSASVTADTGSQSETLSLELAHQDQPSTSYDSCNNTTFRNVIHSNVSFKDRPMYGSKLVEDENQLKPGASDDLLEYALYNDHVTSDSESNEIEQDAEKYEDRVLYSSDHKGIARKPTIDQEFEQYFSMLML